MSTPALITLILATVVLFGGLTLSITSAVRAERRAAAADHDGP